MLRMIHAVLGEEVFRDSLRYYLTKNAFDSADNQTLIDAFALVCMTRTYILIYLIQFNLFILNIIFCINNSVHSPKPIAGFLRLRRRAARWFPLPRALAEESVGAAHRRQVRRRRSICKFLTLREVRAYATPTRESNTTRLSRECALRVEYPVVRQE